MTRKPGRGKRLQVAARVAPGPVSQMVRQVVAAAPYRAWLWREMAALAVVGLGVAGYLAYSSLAATELYCAGIGDCDAVNHSVYAKLAGFPVSLFGLASYLAVLFLSVLRSKLHDDWAFLGSLGILTLTLSGTVFSGYLTYVEFFVLQAICPWCLVSAALTVALLVLAALVVRHQLEA